MNAKKPFTAGLAATLGLATLLIGGCAQQKEQTPDQVRAVLTPGPVSPQKTAQAQQFATQQREIGLAMEQAHPHSHK